MIARSEAKRALAKALAYDDCGRQTPAKMYALLLVQILLDSGIISKGDLV